MNISNEVRQSVSALALQEHAEAVGKLFRVGYLCGYLGNDSADVQCFAIVRVLPTPKDSVLHFNDEWLDPYWDVELVQGDERARSLRSIWIDGPSYNMLTGERSFKNVEPLSAVESVKVRILTALGVVK